MKNKFNFRRIPFNFDKANKIKRSLGYEVKDIDKAKSRSNHLIYAGKSETRRKAEKVSKVLINTIIVSFVMLILYLPIILIAILSFNSSRNLAHFGELTLRWYKELFIPIDSTGKEFQDVVVTTLCVSILSTIISTVLGTFFAIGINSLKQKNRQKMIMINNIPVVNADIVTGITLMILFSIFVPILNIWTVLIAHIFFCTPYVILSVLPKLSTIDQNLYDAAVDLGCSPLKAITKVIIPSIMPGILMGALMAFTMSIDDFTISYYTGASLEGFYNVSTYIYLVSTRKTPSFSMYAYNTLITLGTLLVLVIYNVLTNIKINKNKRKGDIA